MKKEKFSLELVFQNEKPNSKHIAKVKTSHVQIALVLHFFNAIPSHQSDAIINIYTKLEKGYVMCQVFPVVL